MGGSTIGMETREKILIGAGVLISLILLIINIYLGLIVLVIVIALVMSFLIMQDSRFHPDLVAYLTDDSKEIRIKNQGNAAAKNIHISLVPLNIEFDIPELREEEEFPYRTGTMVPEVKAVIIFENEKGGRYSKTSILSPFHPGEEDLLKPMFPLFKWK
jgi:hypothetical protein